MGYFVAGILIDGDPDWSRLERLPEKIGLRGYKHRENDMCLLDFWPANLQRNFSPFTGGHEFPEIAKLPADKVIERFEQHCRIVDQGETVYGFGWLRLAFAVSESVGLTTFCFASDDEDYDFAALAGPKGIVRIACRFGHYDLYYAQSEWMVTPRLYLEEDDAFRAKVSDPILGMLKNRLVQIGGELKIEGGDQLCEHPVAEWPTHLGDPTALLGLGTFDPLLDFDEHFEVVYERAPANVPVSSAVPSPAPAATAQKSVNIDFIVQKYLAGRKECKFGPFKAIPGGPANEKILFAIDAASGQFYVSNARLILVPRKRFGFLSSGSATESAWLCDLLEIPREISQDGNGKMGLALKFSGRDEWTILGTPDSGKALCATSDVFRWIRGQHDHRPEDLDRVGLIHAPHCPAKRR